MRHLPIAYAEKNITQVDDAHDIDVLMPMYNLIEYMVIIQKHLEFSDNIRDEPGLDDNYDDDVVRFNTPNATTNSFEIKENVTGQTDNNGILKQLH